VQLQRLHAAQSFPWQLHRMQDEHVAV
jgi:hypothetical protein